MWDVVHSRSSYGASNSVSSETTVTTSFIYNRMYLHSESIAQRTAREGAPTTVQDWRDTPAQDGEGHDPATTKGIRQHVGGGSSITRA